ncbi:MAG: hypothetical protein D6736_15800 [Nitrospinota bacterium]|nr:MAG: hypothetical protein D6736_15800 [Nitrospinota bacterium]
MVAGGYSYLIRKDLIAHREAFAVKIAQNLTQHLEDHLSQLSPSFSLETLLQDPPLPVPPSSD